MILDLPPHFRGIRAIGDVHGEANQFRAGVEGAAALDMFVLQLGDLTDHGPDAPDVLRRMRGLVEARAGLFLLGNHDHKLRRALLGEKVRSDRDGLGATLAQLDAHPDGATLSAWAITAIERAPAWLRWGPYLFVHGGFHTAMLIEPSPIDAGALRPEGPLSRALFGQTVKGQLTAAGYPVRVLDWVDRIPRGLTVVCGHDIRSRNGIPLRLTGSTGGVAIFLDTGAGKGGHLSWIDLIP